jgi:hypothetical protein
MRTWVGLRELRREGKSRELGLSSILQGKRFKADEARGELLEKKV